MLSSLLSLMLTSTRSHGLKGIAQVHDGVGNRTLAYGLAGKLSQSEVEQSPSVSPDGLLAFVKMDRVILRRPGELGVSIPFKRGDRAVVIGWIEDRPILQTDHGLLHLAGSQFVKWKRGQYDLALDDGKGHWALFGTDDRDWFVETRNAHIALGWPNPESVSCIPGVAVFSLNYRNGRTFKDVLYSFDFATHRLNRILTLQGCRILVSRPSSNRRLVIAVRRFRYTWAGRPSEKSTLYAYDSLTELKKLCVASGLFRPLILSDDGLKCYGVQTDVTGRSDALISVDLRTGRERRLIEGAFDFHVIR